MIHLIVQNYAKSEKSLKSFLRILTLIPDYIRIRNFFGILHSCKILEKSLEWFLRKTITEGKTD